jgi:hypothetical protein
MSSSTDLDTINQIVWNDIEDRHRDVCNMVVTIAFHKNLKNKGSIPHSPLSVVTTGRWRIVIISLTITTFDSSADPLHIFHTDRKFGCCKSEIPNFKIIQMFLKSKDKRNIIFFLVSLLFFFPSFFRFVPNWSNHLYFSFGPTTVGDYSSPYFLQGQGPAGQHHRGSFQSYVYVRFCNVVRGTARSRVWPCGNWDHVRVVWEH